MLNSRFANLRSVDLVFAELHDADLRKETDLRGADLDHAGVRARGRVRVVGLRTRPDLTEHY